MWRRPPPLDVVSGRLRLELHRAIPVTSLVVVSAPPIRRLVGPKVDVELRTDELVARPVSSDSSTPRHRCVVPRWSSRPVARPPHLSSVHWCEPSRAANRREGRRSPRRRLPRRRPVARRSGPRAPSRRRRLRAPDRVPRPRKVSPNDSPAAPVNPSLRRIPEPKTLAGPSTTSCRDRSRRERTPARQPLPPPRYARRAIPHRR